MVRSGCGLAVYRSTLEGSKARKSSFCREVFSRCPFGPMTMPETDSRLSLKQGVIKAGFRGVTERFGQDSGQRGRGARGGGRDGRGEHWAGWRSSSYIFLHHNPLILMNRCATPEQMTCALRVCCQLHCGSSGTHVGHRKHLLDIQIFPLFIFFSLSLSPSLWGNWL